MPKRTELDSNSRRRFMGQAAIGGTALAATAVSRVALAALPEVVSQEAPGSTIPKMARLGLDYRRSGGAIPAVDAALKRFYDEERRMLMRAVRSGLAAGIFHDVEPGPFARFVSTYLDGVVVRTLILHESGSAVVDRFRAEVWRRLGLKNPSRRKKFIAD